MVEKSFRLRNLLVYCILWFLVFLGTRSLAYCVHFRFLNVGEADPALALNVLVGMKDVARASSNCIKENYQCALSTWDA